MLAQPRRQNLEPDTIGGVALNADARVLAAEVAIPSYLAETYWWAYVHPRALHLFERQWVVNLILWGNFNRLRDAALAELGGDLHGRTLQVACVYGDLTCRMAARLARGAQLHVVDVLRIQLENLARKLPVGLLRRHGHDGHEPPAVELIHGDSSALTLRSASYDRALLFFLLHEQPAEVRRETLMEALRVVKPGGRVVVVDYHRPHPLHPLYWPMFGVFRALEPYALDLWRDDLASWIPPGTRVAALQKRTFFGGLYQLVSITV
jgi:ubiquinone/menaquinone biosynthesis C-methylase UbiE